MLPAVSVPQANISILSDLAKTCSDETIEIILKHLEGTSISSFSDVYEHIQEYKKKTDSFPAKDYLEARYPNTCSFRSGTLPPTSGLVVYFLSELKREYLTYKSAEFISKGDLDSLEEITKEYKSSRLKVVDYGFSTVASTYGERKVAGPGINTGVPDIDQHAMGLGYGTLNTIAGPAGSGKTTLARSIAYNVAYNERKNVVFITMEISRDDMKAMFISRHSKTMGIPMAGRDIIKCLLEPEYREYLHENTKKSVLGKVEQTKEKLAKVAEDFERNAQGRIFIVEEADFPDWSVSGFRAYLEKLDDEVMEETGRGIDVVMLDYIQLVKPSGARMNIDLKDYRNLFIQGFRSCCVSFKNRQLIGILLSQINRTGMKAMDGKADKPGGKIVATFQDLAELNSIERECSVIAVIYSNVVSRSGNMMYAQVIKNRLGSSMENMVPVLADFKHNSVGENKCLKADVINDEVLTSDVFGDDFDEDFSIEKELSNDED